MRGDCAVALATCQGSCVRVSGQVITCPALTQAMTEDRRIASAQNAALAAVPALAMGVAWLPASPGQGVIAASVVAAVQLAASRIEIRAQGTYASLIEGGSLAGGRSLPRRCPQAWAQRLSPSCCRARLSLSRWPAGLHSSIAGVAGRSNAASASAPTARSSPRSLTQTPLRRAAAKRRWV